VRTENSINVEGDALDNLDHRRPIFDKLARRALAARD
jgi:hypothetical protein